MFVFLCFCNVWETVACTVFGVCQLFVGRSWGQVCLMLCSLFGWLWDVLVNPCRNPWLPTWWTSAWSAPRTMDGPSGMVHGGSSGKMAGGMSGAHGAVLRHMSPSPSLTLPLSNQKTFSGQTMVGSTTRACGWTQSEHQRTEFTITCCLAVDGVCIKYSLIVLRTWTARPTKGPVASEGL